ncbi:polyphosphate kinase 1 [Ottowia testudinis]|uniref:Polyphosphate kinase n=1 Tax=Ottowia testudinis TaxID=2816950 RepID=A0A975CJB1_9BURK|nr:polyphosphate kinase 1 [Ottowia testudinis]QTD44473.1 polyphosphate kinase 1 [Ottowia testudinis]
MPTAAADTAAILARYPLHDRDLSILDFNHRVLHWAERPDVPLLERLRYLCIVSSNLDEFFEVRAEPHLTAWRDGADASGGMRQLMAAAHQLVDRQYAIYNEVLLPAMAARRIRIVSHLDRSEAQRKWVRDHFLREVKPLLVPVALDPAHPFPLVANKSLNFIVQLKGKDAFGRSNEIAIVKVPRVLPRVLRLPERVAGQEALFVMLSSVVRAHLPDLFPGREVGDFSHFRVTRDSDMSVDEAEVKNLRTALRQELHQRHYGEAVRVEVSSACSEELASFLLRQFKLPPEALFKVQGPVNLVRLQQLIQLADEQALLFAPYRASYPVQLAPLARGDSVFERLRRGDVLIHQPFESFDGVIDFLREAVHDPLVLAIKQTIYRTGNDSRMMDLLIDAQQRGKEVTAVVELKARFDEEANINWAEHLERAGAQVVYGVVGLKTHAKMLLVTRREGRQLRRYGHLSTGNYNPRTAALYTDLSMLTADARLTSDMDQLFVHLASHSRLPRMQRMLLAPFTLHKQMLAKIEAVAQAARKGQGGRIVAKMNALTDEALIVALLRAGDAGAKIDLIVRGACMLPAALTHNIRVRSIIGRFLEHSRVFYFRAGADEQLWLSSADWMNRNMLRRVETAWQVTDYAMRQRIVDECLLAYLHDERDAWLMGVGGHYHSVVPAGGQPGPGAQDALMARYRAN